MMRVLCNAVSWRRAPHIGQACLFPPSALFAEMNPVGFPAIIIIFFPFWWLSYNKLFYLSTPNAREQI